MPWSAPMPLRINVPALTRVLLVALLALSFLNGAIRYTQWSRSRGDSSVSGVQVPYLTLVPQSAIFYPWVFLTTTLVEPNIFALVVTAVTILYGGKYLERAWGSVELAKFLLLVTLPSNIIAWATYLIGQSMVNEKLKFSTVVCGASAIQGGFLVASKQLIPEHTVAIARGLLSVRVKYLPILFLLCNTVVALVLRASTSLLLASAGFFAAWIYLRFYKANPDLVSSATGRGARVRGDASDAFAFATFFPEPLSLAVGAVADRIYALLVMLRVCTPFSAEDVLAGNEQAMAREEGGLPSFANGSGGRAGGVRSGGKREEAERRRALALKALDQRLHAAASRAQQTASSAPSSSSDSGAQLDGSAEPTAR